MLTGIITNNNQSSAKNSQGAGSESSTGSETTTGSVTGPQQIGTAQISTPTGVTTFGNQSSVNTANALQMISGLLSNLANAGSQASQEVQQRGSSSRTSISKRNARDSLSGHCKRHDCSGDQSYSGSDQRSNKRTIAKTVNENYITLEAIFSGLIAAIAWNLLTWWFGIPSSSSHHLS